ncbi:MAG: alpha/beta fold hydrolase, partial [Bradyrhizobium sp.]
RIKAYVGQMPAPKTYDEAAATLKAIMAGSFPAFGDADWSRLARRTFVEKNGLLAADHDPALTASLEALSPDKPLPPLWPFFDGLKDVPLLAIRGELSDILSAETLAAMAARRPDMETLTVPGQGHAPMLWEEEVIARIAGFARRADGG